LGVSNKVSPYFSVGFSPVIFNYRGMVVREGRDRNMDISRFNALAESFDPRGAD